MFHVHPHKLSWPYLCVIFLFAIPLGMMEMQEYLHVCRVQRYPIVEGRVIDFKNTQLYGIPRVRFTIKVVGTTDVVYAVLTESEAAKLGTDVRFHYNGTPGQEVPLIGEDGALGAVIFLWGAPLLLLGLYIFLKRNRLHPSLVD